MSASPPPAPAPPRPWPLRVLAGAGRGLRHLLLSVRLWIVLILVFIALLVAYSAQSNLHTPFTNDAYVQAYVVQVAPRVEGEVVRVYASENKSVGRGDTLFEIDARPFRHKVAQLEAKLAFTATQVAQMETEVEASRAEEARIAAEEAYAQAVFKQEEAIFKQESTTERKYLDAKQKYQVAQAGRERSKAALLKARQALDSRIGEEHALIAEVKAELADARLDLEWTRVAAPADGLITNLQLREGSYAHAGKPVLTCIERDQWWVVANFRENCLQNVQPGQRVGLTFLTYPGRVFSGTVQSVGWGVAEGQGAPSGDLPQIKNPSDWIRLAQRFQVWIKPDLPAEHPLRVGMTATVTVYTDEEFGLNGVAAWWQEFVAWCGYVF
jgi:multidrug resistance efflux pump